MDLSDVREDDRYKPGRRDCKNLIIRYIADPLEKMPDSLAKGRYLDFKKAPLDVQPGIGWNAGDG